LSAQDSFFFKQSTTDLLSYSWDEDSNVGAFEETAELEDINDYDTFLGNTKNKKVQKWTKQVEVSAEAFKADAVGKRARIGSQIGLRARTTQDKKAILNTYGDAFAGSINTTPDGQPLASSSHVTLKGFTVDNLETGVLNADNLWTLVQSLQDMLAQDGELGSYVFEGLVVPSILYKTAKETMNSQLVPFSGENQINIFDTDYGTVRVASSAYLNSGQNSATNANTSYHIVSGEHMINRKVFEGLSMDLIDPTKSKNDKWAYRGRFLESHFPESWCGYAASNGTV